MPSKPSSRACAWGVLALALALLSTSCATCPPDPPAPLPIPWPALPAPPETGIELAADGRVAVPLDYWTELVGYIRTLDDVRAMLAREGRIVPEK